MELLGRGRFMKALLLSKYRSLEIADVPTPAAGVGEVLIRVGACGICGSDGHGYDGWWGGRGELRRWGRGLRDWRRATASHLIRRFIAGLAGIASGAK